MNNPGYQGSLLIFLIQLQSQFGGYIEPLLKFASFQGLDNTVCFRNILIRYNYSISIQSISRQLTRFNRYIYFFREVSIIYSCIVGKSTYSLWDIWFWYYPKINQWKVLDPTIHQLFPFLYQWFLSNGCNVSSYYFDILACRFKKIGREPF